MTEGQCLLLRGVEKSKPLYTRYGPFIIKSEQKVGVNILLYTKIGNGKQYMLL